MYRPNPIWSYLIISEVFAKKQKRLAQWQKDLRALILQLEYALPDEKLIADLDLSQDNTGNPYFVQFLNT